MSKNTAAHVAILWKSCRKNVSGRINHKNSLRNPGGTDKLLIEVEDRKQSVILTTSAHISPNGHCSYLLCRMMSSDLPSMVVIWEMKLVLLCYSFFPPNACCENVMFSVQTLSRNLFTLLSNMGHLKHECKQSWLKDHIRGNNQN